MTARHNTHTWWLFGKVAVMPNIAELIHKIHKSEKVLSLACSRQRNGDRIITNERRVRSVWVPIMYPFGGLLYHHRGFCIVARGCRKQQGYTKQPVSSTSYCTHMKCFPTRQFRVAFASSRTFSTQHSTHHSYDCCTAGACTLEQQMVVASCIDAANLENMNYRFHTAQCKQFYGQF